MTDRPILFSGPMVRALLDGRKTQTRRVLHVQPPEWVNYCEQPQMLNVLHQWVPSGLWRWAELDENQDRALRQWPLDEDGQHYWLRPRFRVGDRLWVREAWRCNGWATDLATIFYRASEGDGYSAMCEQIPVEDRKPMRVTGTWRPGIHMPRWASRLTLAVTEVRVQRLQDISEADAIAEGVERVRDAADPHRMSTPEFRVEGACAGVTAPDTYAALWDGLNAKRGFGWAANPWVVALTFTVHHQNIDAPGAKEAA